MVEVSMFNQWYIGRGVDSSTGKVFGEAIKRDLPLHYASGASSDTKAEFAALGSIVNFELVSINSQEDLSSAMNVQASAYLRSAFGAKASGEASFVKNRKISSSNIYALVKCEIKTSPLFLQNKQFTDEAAAKLKTGWTQFMDSYGLEYVEGFILGGSYYGLIEVLTTDSETKVKVDAALKAQYGPIKMDSSFSNEMQAISKIARTKVYVHKVGGDDSKIANTLGEMIEQASNFPQSVKKSPMAYIALVTDYASTVPLPTGVSKPNLSDQIKYFSQQKILNTVGKRYLELVQYTNNLDDVVNHLGEFNEYSNLSESDLDKKKQDFIGTGKKASQEKAEIEFAAIAYNLDLDEKHFENIKKTELNPPLPAGDSMITQQILSGNCSKTFPDNHEFRTVSGARQDINPISFSKKFKTPPTVVVNLKTLDVAHDRNTRVSVDSTDITTDGFNLRYSTWSDSVIYMMDANWIAYGS